MPEAFVGIHYHDLAINIYLEVHLGIQCLSAGLFGIVDFCQLLVAQVVNLHATATFTAMLSSANPVLVDQVFFSLTDYGFVFLPICEVFDLVQSLKIVVIVFVVPWNPTFVTLTTDYAQQSTRHVLLLI